MRAVVVRRLTTFAFVPTALLSVYDKSGVVELAADLYEQGWSLVSSGGTAHVIADAGVPVTDVVDWTGVPAILGHRVVTLHPKIFGGLLADPSDPAHRVELKEYDITPIDLVVVNLYPFGSAVDEFVHGGSTPIDLVDVGGSALVRAAAKNHAFVGVVVDPSDYGPIATEIRRDGALSSGTRRRLARSAFAHTAAYDAAIVTWFDTDGVGDADMGRSRPNSGELTVDRLPDSIHLALEHAQPLRYGENPHQRSARYRQMGTTSWWDTMIQHGGKVLSYLNMYDTEAAWRLVHRFDAPTVAVVKHANPCGVAIADDITAAYVAANACDPVSAFGGVVAANRTVTAEMAASMSDVFTEVIVATGFDDDALEILTAKKNLRILNASPPSPLVWDIRRVDGGLLVQDTDPIPARTSDWRVVTERQPSDGEWRDLEFAWVVCAAVNSNAVVYAKDRQAFGIGAGQQNRLDSARIAAEKAAGRAVGGAAASDAFFPFSDGLDAAAAAGISVVVQPGGALRDSEVIAAADDHGMAMVFTGIRHFRH